MGSSSDLADAADRSGLHPLRAPRSSASFRRPPLDFDLCARLPCTFADPFCRDVLPYRPQLPVLVKSPPKGDQWLHELKHDGYRMGLAIEDQHARACSRNGVDWTSSLKELCAEAETLPVRSALIDGEVAVLLPDGRSSFQRLQNAFKGGQRRGLVYFAFDLLHLDGEDLAAVPLEKRKELLRDVLERATGRATGHPSIRYCDHVVGNGPAVFEQARKLGCEGIVSKRRDLPYVAGRSDTWRKTKCMLAQEFVVGGFTERAGERASVGALVLGYYDEDGHLACAGNVGTGKGWTASFLRELRAGLEPLRQDTCPFDLAIPRELRRAARWVRPALVVEVEFSEWTDEGSIRQSTFRGFRTDVQAVDVRREAT
jgi:bifunctional non-homologous end joining protein LigD